MISNDDFFDERESLLSPSLYKLLSGDNKAFGSNNNSLVLKPRKQTGSYSRLQYRFSPFEQPFYIWMRFYLYSDPKGAFRAVNTRRLLSNRSLRIWDKDKLLRGDDDLEIRRRIEGLIVRLEGREFDEGVSVEDQRHPLDGFTFSRYRLNYILNYGEGLLEKYGGGYLKDKDCHHVNGSSLDDRCCNLQFVHFNKHRNYHSIDYERYEHFDIGSLY